MRIAICMIVKNEEKVLRSCLESVKGIGDIYVLDTGSTDKTVEIASEYTDKVFTNIYTWNDNFAEARNFVLGLCKDNYDWVLSIDADEVLITPEKVIPAIKAAGQFKTVNVILRGAGTKSDHWFPRIFRPAYCEWRGAIHNYLSVSENNNSDVIIEYGYSPAHAADPDRAFRILEKEAKVPGKVRELYYLAREYWYRKDFNKAIEWYKKYLEVAWWAPEMADANLMIAKCYKKMNNFREATDYAFNAIKINNDFKEALEFIADLMGPKNSERWINFAYSSTNQDVLFINQNQESGREAYDSIYITDSPERYNDIYRQAAFLMNSNYPKGNVLDIGCGTAELSKYVGERYNGIDFSSKAIEFAGQKTPNVAAADLYAYDYSQFEGFFMLEVLEHVDDIKLLNMLPFGAYLVISVPSFMCPGHLRRYTQKIVEERYKRIIGIETIKRFNWNGKWEMNGKNTNDHITLFGGVRI